MTIAVCTGCGRKKFGAFCRCDHCGFTPSSEEDRAKSVMLSDHHYTPFELDILSKSIQSGKKITYDTATLAEYEKTLSLLEAEPDALQCAVCGEDLDSLDSTLCPTCVKESNLHTS